VTAVDTIRRHKAEVVKLAAQVDGVRAATTQQRVLASAREHDVSLRRMPRTGMWWWWCWWGGGGAEYA
jgi:hypothetical protein